MTQHRGGLVALGRKEELVFLGREISEQRNYSDEIAELIDEEVARTKPKSRRLSDPDTL